MPVLDMFAELRKVNDRLSLKRNAGYKDKFVLDIKVGGLYFKLDDKEIAAKAALVIQDEIRSAMLGNVPGIFPAISPATATRRKWRRKQGARGGEIAMRYRDENRDKAAHWDSWRRRFKTTLLGEFNPADSNVQHLFGIESGLLLKSIKAVQSGAGWRIHVANIRAIADKKGGSALSRVFGRVNLGQLMRGQAVQKELRKIPGMIVFRRLSDLLRESARTLRLVRNLASELKDDKWRDGSS